MHGLGLLLPVFKVRLGLSRHTPLSLRKKALTTKSLSFFLSSAMLFESSESSEVPNFLICLPSASSGFAKSVRAASHGAGEALGLGCATAKPTVATLTPSATSFMRLGGGIRPNDRSRASSRRAAL